MPFSPMKRDSSPDDDESVDNGGGASVAAGKRACDYCHRMKMRCINKENPPCNRCRQSGHPCTFEGPRKSKASKVEDRLKMVESQMSAFQSSLNELVALQRSAMGGAGPSSAMGVNLPPPMSGMNGSPGDYRLPHDPRGPGSAFGPRPSGMPPPLPAPGNRPPGNILSIGSFFEETPQTTMTGARIEPTRNRSLPSINEPYGPSVPRPAPSSMQDLNPSSAPSNGRSWTLPAPNSGRPTTAISSAAVSDDEDEPERIEATIAQGPWRSMLSLAEAARLEADGHLGKDETVDGDEDAKDEGEGGKKNKHHPFDFSDGDGPARKKRKSTIADDLTGLKGALPQQKGSHTHAFQDPVEMGYCTEEKGKALFKSFMENSSFYVPVFDPETDTWESLRKRSPFCITTILMVAQKAEDAGGPQSELQKQCREHAEKIGMSTLFTPVARIEVVQALMIMAAWGDTAWRPAGHALRIGTEMGLWRCLPYLIRTGMGQGKGPEELKDEGPLVIGARVWMTLYLTECQLALNYGRPTMFINPESVASGRQFLKHPLTIPTDARVVNFCELQTIRISLCNPFTLTTTSAFPDLDRKILEANQAMDDWYSYWDHYYELLGYSTSSLQREALVTMKNGTLVYTNSVILHDVRSRRDVAMLSEYRHHLLVTAANAAQELVSMTWKGKAWAEKFKYGNLNTHLNIAFNARFLIRMASLLPEALNLRQVGRDIEAVVKALSTVPGFQFSDILRDVLSRARKKRVLPPASKPGSPTRAPQKLPPVTANTGPTPPMSTSKPTPTGMMGETPPGFPTGPPTSSSNPGSDGAFALSGGSEGPGHLDFIYADQLFNDNGAFDSLLHFDAAATPAVPTFSQLDPSTFTYDTWYSFPPLDADHANLPGQSGGAAAISPVLTNAPLAQSSANPSFNELMRGNPSGGQGQWW